jgi:hypothetical protein
VYAAYTCPIFRYVWYNVIKCCFLNHFTCKNATKFCKKIPWSKSMYTRTNWCSNRDLIFSTYTDLNFKYWIFNLLIFCTPNTPSTVESIATSDTTSNAVTRLKISPLLKLHIYKNDERMLVNACKENIKIHLQRIGFSVLSVYLGGTSNLLPDLGHLCAICALLGKGTECAHLPDRVRTLTLHVGYVYAFDMMKKFFIIFFICKRTTFILFFITNERLFYNNK